MIQIWHNPRCSKSRESLKYLEETNQNFEVKEYLKEEITKEELVTLLVKIDLKAKDIIRNTESIYKELNVKDISDENELIEVMIKNPKLIQRPIIVKDNKAVIGRPLEKVEGLLK